MASLTLVALAVALVWPSPAAAQDASNAAR